MWGELEFLTFETNSLKYHLFLKIIRYNVYIT